MGCVSSRIDPESDKEEKKVPKIKNPNVLSGDVTKMEEAKQERQLKMQQRQKILFSKSEEFSGRILEEKERLSLGSRSRGTSRATSRAASPSTTTRKQVSFRPDDVKLHVSSSVSSFGSQNNLSVPGNAPKETKSALKNSNGNVLLVKSDSHGNKANQNGRASQKDQSNVLSQESESKEVKMDMQGRELSVIEERNNSRCSNKTETEFKRG